MRPPTGQPLRIAIACIELTLAILAGVTALAHEQRPALASSSSYSSTVLGDSPSVYYRLDESAGPTAHDSSPNGINATYASSGVTYGTAGGIVGDPDTAVTLGNINAPTIRASDTSLPSGSAARTIEFWMNSLSASNTGEMVLGYGTNSGRGDFEVWYVQRGTLLFTDGTDSLPVNASYSFADGNWHQIAFTYDGATNLAFFLDGQHIGSATLGASLNTAVGGQGLIIGDDLQGDVYSGNLDEVAIYPSALSASTINNHWRVGRTAVACPAKPTSGYAGVVAADNPSAFWRLTELNGTAAEDWSGNCQYGLISPADAHRSIPGPIITDPGGGGISVPPLGGPSFDASADGLPLGPNARSVEFWINTLAADNLGLAYFTYGNSTGTQFYEIGLVQRGILFFSDGTNSYSVATPYSVADGNWHQIVYTYDGATTLDIYLDGILLGTKTLTAALNTTINPGQGVVLNNGNFADVAVYPTVLSAARVADHYIASAPAGGSYSGSQTFGGGNFCVPCALAVAHRSHGYPIDTSNGNMWDTWTDFSISGRGNPLTFTRTYNSAAAATNGPLGFGWQTNLNMSLSLSGSNVTITQENGSTASFSLSGSTWLPSAPRYIATLTHNGDGTWTFVRLGTGTFQFNSSGQLTSAADLNGYATSYAYTSGLLTSVTEDARSGGRSLTIGYAGSLITSVTDANVTPNRVAQYEYNDGLGNLTDVIDVNGGHWQFTYDSNHRMTVMKDPQCFATTGCPGIVTAYDSSGRATSQQDQLGRQTTYDYTSIPGGTKVTDPKSNVEVDYYNQGMEVAETRGYGTSQAATWQYGYDPNTLARTGVIDPNGNLTTYQYDTSGNPLVVTDPLGRMLTRTYNGFNEILSTQDGNQVLTTSAYDASGNLLWTCTPVTGTSGCPAAQSQTNCPSSSTLKVVCNVYGDSGHPGDLTSMVDADGKTWRYGYDSFGNRASTTDPLGDESTWSYNADDWLLSSVTARGNVAGCNCASQYTTQYGYVDTLNGHAYGFGDIATVTDPLGNVTASHYDLDRNLTSSKDADGNTTAYVFDLANELTDVNRADATHTHTDYNADGTVMDQKDAKGNAILTFGYDSLARVTASTDALNNTTNFTYDGNGNLLTQQDPSGNCSSTPAIGCTTRTHDADNELTGITYSDGVTPNISNLTYDGDGQRLSMSDGTGTSSWTWDDIHRLTSFKDGHQDQVSYQYNLSGAAATQITYPGVGNVTRAYDDAGRLHTVQDWLGNLTTFNYFEDGTLKNTTYPASSGVVDTLAYNGAQQLTSISDVRGANTLFAATYGRDANGQVASDSSLASSVGSYRYTALNQVCYAGSSNSSACSAPPSGSQAYAYDAADNLTSDNGATQGFNAADQLCWTVAGTNSNACGTPPTGATTYTLNSRGDRTAVTPASGSATSLGYDQANRLTSWNQGSTSATYTYNGDGLRMSKTVGGATSTFTWDVSGSLPLLLSDGTSQYIYGPSGTPIEQLSGTPGISRVGNGTTANGKVTSLSISLPSGLQANDQVLIASTQPASTTVTAPSGYASVTSVTSGGNKPTSTTVFRHAFASGDPTSVTFTYSSSHTAQTLVAVAYRGVDPTLPVDVFSSASGTGTTTVTAPSQTVNYPSEELVDFQGASGTFASSVAWTAPTGMAEETQVNPANTAGGIADQTLTNAGSTGTRASTFGATANLTTVVLALATKPILFLHSDQIGSTRMVTDLSGVVRGTATYDPYGNQTGSTGSSTSPFAFAGQFKDSESSLYYLRGRYYDPASGQFISRDPLTATTRQPYSYVLDNPLYATDASGLDYQFGPNPGHIRDPGEEYQAYSTPAEVAFACSSTPGAGDAVTRWNPVVACVLGLLGIPANSPNLRNVDIIIQGESGGNPTVCNLTDINAQEGHPSCGLIQVIQPTFDKYKCSNLSDNLTDPAGNIYAGLNYGIHRYGSIENIPGVVSVNTGGSYVGY